MFEASPSHKVTNGTHCLMEIKTLKAEKLIIYQSYKFLCSDACFTLVWINKASYATTHRNRRRFLLRRNEKECENSFNLISDSIFTFSCPQVALVPARTKNRNRRKLLRHRFFVFHHRACLDVRRSINLI